MNAPASAAAGLARPTPGQAPPTEPVRPRALALLALSALPLVLGALLDVDARRAQLLGLEGPACTLRSLLGELACPGCGLTRSTALAVQGRLAEALAVHAAGPLVALLAVVGALLALATLAASRRTSGRLLLRYSRTAPALLGVAVAIGWVLRLLDLG